jgi:hypothetical protein
MAFIIDGIITLPLTVAGYLFFPSKSYFPFDFKNL